MAARFSRRCPTGALRIPQCAGSPIYPVSPDIPALFSMWTTPPLPPFLLRPPIFFLPSDRVNSPPPLPCKVYNKNRHFPPFLMIRFLASLFGPTPSGGLPHAAESCVDVPSKSLPSAVPIQGPKGPLPSSLELGPKPDIPSSHSPFPSVPRRRSGD